MTAIELLNKANKEQINIIDIRNKTKFEHYHIPGATNLEKGEIMLNHNSLFSLQSKYYIICNSGNSSNTITKFLLSKKYNVENVEGGMNPLI